MHIKHGAQIHRNVSAMLDWRQGDLGHSECFIPIIVTQNDSDLAVFILLCSLQQT